MTDPPLAVVVNPTAGGGRPARYMRDVAAVLDAAGASYTMCESRSLEHAQTLARQAAQRGETVVAFGGDGLTSAIAHAIARRADGEHSSSAEPCALGIIPVGRGNDFARTHGIPFDPVAAARVLLTGRLQPVDLIAVTTVPPQQAVQPAGQLITEQAGRPATQPAPTMVAGSVYIGIASVAGEIANRTRLIRGPAVYNLAALRALLGWEPTTFRVDTTGEDGQEVSNEFRGYAVVVANTPYFGAGMKVAPGAHTGDGMLDVVIMRNAPKLTFVRALMKIKDGSHVALSEVSMLRARTVAVTVSRQLPVGADGELLPITAPIRLVAVPAAVAVIVPA